MIIDILRAMATENGAKVRLAEFTWMAACRAWDNSSTTTMTIRIGFVDFTLEETMKYCELCSPNERHDGTIQSKYGRKIDFPACPSLIAWGLTLMIDEGRTPECSHYHRRHAATYLLPTYVHGSSAPNGKII